MSHDRILIYAINGTGMGHLNRTLVLARAAREHDPSVEILFAVASPMFGLVANAGFPVLKVLDRSHSLGAHACCSHRKFHLNAVFEPIIQSFRPSAFVVDLTIDAKLFRTASGAQATVAAVLRKPRPSALWGLALDPGSRGVDRFLLPHPHEEFSVRELPANMRSRGRQLGAVVKTIDPVRVQAMAAKYKQGSRPLVVAAVGGGGYEESRRTVAVVEEAAMQTPQIDWVIVYGPFYSEQLPSGEGTNVRRIRFEPELFELFATADAVVCNAGYNTIREMEVLGTPAVVIPVKGTGRDDQFERARLFAQSGRGVIGDADSEKLQESVCALVNGRVPRATTSQGSLAPLGKRFLEALNG